MKKNSPYNNNEIDLIELIKIIWDGKIKILSITLILFAIFYSYNLLQPKQKPIVDLYKNSITVKRSNNSEFFNFYPIYNYLKPETFKKYSDQSNISSQSTEEFFTINNKRILDNFLIEILDYEELIFVLKNNKTVAEKIAKLTEEEQLNELYNYAKLFTISKPTQPISNQLDGFDINFIWPDVVESAAMAEECKKILDQTIKLTIINLQESIFKGLENMLEIKKNHILAEDTRRIDFLLEQSLIAKELNFDKSQVDISELTGEYNLALNINTNQNSYYLRGYKVIDKEIDIIKNRKYSELSNIKNVIDVLRKSNIQWINYNIFMLKSVLVESRSKESTTIPLHFSIVFGLIIGLIYVYISHVTRSSKVTRNK